MNLVTRRDAGDDALGGQSTPVVICFWCPGANARCSARGSRRAPARPRTAAVNEADVAAFIAELNFAFPSLDLTGADVTLVHRGIVPAVAACDGRVSLEGHEYIRDHADATRGLMDCSASPARIHDGPRSRRANHRFI